ALALVHDGPAPQGWRMPSPASERLVRLLEPLGVTILDVSEPGYFRPGHTKCGAVLTGLLDEHGPEHVVMTVRTIVESKPNATALREAIILAVSDVMLAFPGWPEQGLRWLESFDSISLLGLNEAAKPLRHHRRRIIAGMLLQILKPIFDPASEPEAPVAPGLIEIGVRLLRHAALHPTWTDRQ